MSLIYEATHKDGPNIKDWVTKCKSSRIGFHLSCPTGPSCWIGLCVCVIVLSEEVDRLQMISEGMDQTVKKSVCV